MANLWEKFDKQIDVEGLAKDVKEAAENGGGNYKEVPHGEYEVAIYKIELVQSKKGDPMVTIWFKVLSGDYKGNMIFFNQVVTQGFQIHIVDELLRSMQLDTPILFESYSQYGDMLMDIWEEVDSKLEFALKYGENNKGYSTYEITEVFETAGK